MPVDLTQAFKVVSKDLSNGNELCVIDIDQIDDNLKAFIDSKFVRICEGHASSTLASVKTRLISFLSTKRGSTLEAGAIAEFFVHLYLNYCGFEPQFLYFNLEENSIKKGFDGYYSLSNEEWILESKSGSITTAGITHGKKIKESYNDLKDKLSGGGNNNPWRNAYNHASHIDVGAASNLRNNIKTFSEEYEKNISHKIDDFNIIPGSTIFLDGTWVASDADSLKDEVTSLVGDFKFKRIKIVCITKSSLNIFWDYLNTH